MKKCNKLKKRWRFKIDLPAEHVFSGLFATLIIALLLLMLISNESSRFIKNSFIYCIIILFLILVGILQIFLYKRTKYITSVRYKNLSPSKKIQEIIRSNFLSDNAKRYAMQNMHGGYNDRFSDDKFYTPTRQFEQERRSGLTMQGLFNRSKYANSFDDDPYRLNNPYSRSDRYGRNDRSSYSRFDDYSPFDKKFNDTDFRSDRNSISSSMFESFKKPGSQEKSRFLSMPLNNEPDVGLQDYEDSEIILDKAVRTAERLNLARKIKSLIVNVKSWTHRSLIKMIVDLDLHNLNKLCKILSRYDYRLCIFKDQFQTKSESSLEYEKVINYNYKDRPSFRSKDKIIELRELFDAKKIQNLVFTFKSSHHFVLKSGKVVEIPQVSLKEFENELNIRKQIETYYNIEGFEPRARYYVFDRLFNLSNQLSLKIFNHKGGSFQGK